MDGDLIGTYLWTMVYERSNLRRCQKRLSVVARLKYAWK